MKLAFSTNAFTRHSLPEALEEIAGAGYSGVEILADVPHLFPPEFTAENLCDLQNLLSRTGLEVANLNANTAAGYYGRTFWEPVFEPSLANPDPVARQWRIDYSKRCIDIAWRLNAQCISLTSGKLVPGIRPRESARIFRDALAEVLDHAAFRKIGVGLEYEPGLLIENSKELCELFTQLDSPWLGANLDIGHCRVGGEDISAVIDQLGDRIFNLHVEDIRDRKHYHLVPGEGDIDFSRLFTDLMGIGYQNFITVELYTYPDRPGQVARAAHSFLTDKLAMALEGLAPPEKGSPA